ncbi:MAG TPA: zinc-dependent alcohol dehydrogenase family protein [Anaerolineae bacterium]|nr:zinc-dependent alcohol dehydrogenase family protein [Anaerolineae bacterium]
MRTLKLHQSAPIETQPLVLATSDMPRPSYRSMLLRVRCCGVCHTDLHIVEGDLAPKKLPITPGHQVVAIVEEIGSEVTHYNIGDRVGVPWLNSICGVCEYCRRGEENLCDFARFTGWDVDGGYADYLLADEDIVVPIPAAFSDIDAAPLLCAGIVGYRSIRLADLHPGERLGIFGFGASGHIAIQIARAWNCPVDVFTRSEEHQALARSLGAEWVGRTEDDSPQQLDRAIIFAPSGALIPIALKHLRKGGTLAINAIHTSPIPQMDYQLIYGERTIRTVANATRRDAQEFMSIAAQIPIKSEVQTFPLADANEVLRLLKHSKIKGAAVLVNW